MTSVQVTEPISSSFSLRPARPGLKSPQATKCTTVYEKLSRVEEELHVKFSRVEEELRMKCQELERVDKARKEAQDELKDAAKWGEKMLHKFDSKEKEWVEEREKLLTELRTAKSETTSMAGHDLLQELATLQAQARAEALKAEAFQKSLVAARAALSRKAEQKALADEARLQAVEDAAASVFKQKALEENLVRAEQVAEEAKAAQLQAMEGAAAQQQSLETALVMAQKEAEAEQKRRGTVEKEATLRQELLQSELTAALEERTIFAAKHAAALSIAQAESSRALVAVEEARKEADDARAIAVAQTAKAEAATEAARAEAAKADAAKVAVEKARREVEVAKIKAEVVDAQIVAQTTISQHLEVPEETLSNNIGKSLGLPEAFVEFDATDASIASTMTPRSVSPRIDTDRISTEEVTDDKCGAESAAEMSDAEVGTEPAEMESHQDDTEVGTEPVEMESHSDDTEVDDEVSMSVNYDDVPQHVVHHCLNGESMLRTRRHCPAINDAVCQDVSGHSSTKEVTPSAARRGTEVIKDALRSSMQMLTQWQQQRDLSEVGCAPEPEAEISPVSKGASEKMTSFRHLLPVAVGGSDCEIERQHSGCPLVSFRSFGRQATLFFQRNSKMSAGCKPPSTRQRKGRRGAVHGNRSSKSTHNTFKARATRAFSTSWWPWFTMCMVGVMTILCVLCLRDALHVEVTGNDSAAYDQIEVDHFSVTVHSSVSNKLAEARQSFNLKPEPLQALNLAGLLMNVNQVSEALDVLLHAVELADAATSAPEESAQTICALHNAAGMLLVRTGEAGRAVQYFKQALIHLGEQGHRSHVEYRYKVRLNLASAEMMRSNWDSCSKEAHAASSESATLSDRASQYDAQSLLSGCLFQKDAPPKETLHEARVALRLASEDQLELARENCQALEEVVARGIAGVRMVEKVKMRFAPTFKFLMPDS